jgi:hypothetical protein
MFLIGVAVGLVIGWNFMPQPAFVKNAVDAVRSKLTR